jgi:hypothetical protein
MEDREYLLFRVGTKCGDFARNLSFHRALGNHVKNSGELNFWIHMCNNSIDLAVLDWFHLFGNHNDDLHWKRVVPDVDGFRQGLLQLLGMNEQEWKAYHEKIKDYRDKDVAHIEVRLRSQVPDMTQALLAVAYYYATALKELRSYATYDWPQDLNDYYKKSVTQAEVVAISAYRATLGIKEKVY